jgi:hypothetical protein
MIWEWFTLTIATAMISLRRNRLQKRRDRRREHGQSTPSPDIDTGKDDLGDDMSKHEMPRLRIQGQRNNSVRRQTTTFADAQLLQ